MPRRQQETAGTGGGWTPEMVRAILANPYHAINIHPVFGAVGAPWRDHEPVPPDEWIAANVRAIEEDGPEAWLGSLLDVLSNGSDYGLFNRQCNPCYVIDVDPALTGEHELILPRDQWVRLNARGISEEGAGVWLAALLDVLSAVDILSRLKAGDSNCGKEVSS
jgi:hypothetical protein